MYALLDGSCDITFPEVLFFSTGLKQVPPLGFNPQPQLRFLHEAENNGLQSMYPKGNTCACVLYLPVSHKSFTSFMEAMNFGIRNAHGFGFA